MKLPFNITTPLVSFDTETTGTNTSKDRIVEISFIKYTTNEIFEMKTMIIDPVVEIPKAASDVHGITNQKIADLRASGMTIYTFKQVAPIIREYVRGCDLMAYNSKFDLQILSEEFSRCGIFDFPEFGCKIIDPFVIFQTFEQRNLTAAYKKYCGKELIGAHGSLADTQAATEVLVGQINTYPELQDMDVPALANLCLKDNKSVDLAGKLIYNEDGKIVFNFGKHYLSKVYDVFKKEESYYKWIMEKSDMSSDTKRHCERLYNIVKNNK